MIRRPTRAYAASLGIAALFAATLGGPVLAQETPPEPGPVTEYPNYGGEVTCATAEGPGSFNGAPYGGQIKRISAPDERTVVFDLCAPDPAFLAKIAFKAFSINDTDYLLAHAPDKSIVEQPNGTGPYTLSEWRKGDQIILTANETYWGTPAISPTVVVRWSSTPGQKFIELQSRTVDGIDNPQTDDIEAIQADDSLQLIPRDGFNVFYLGFNTKYPPFDNEKVRQAIGLGIDRKAIVDQFYPPGSEVASHFTPCGTAFGCTGDAWPDFDPEAAKALLAEGLTEAGYTQTDGVWTGSGGPLDVPIQYRVVTRTYLPLADQVALAIVDQLQTNLGITAHPDEVESTTFIDIANAGLLNGIHLLGWNGDFPDIVNFLDYHLGGGRTTQLGPVAPTNVYQDIADALVKGSSTVDEATREAAYTEANNLIRQRVPLIPIAHGASATAWQAGIAGAHSSPYNAESYSVIDGGEDGQLVVMQSGEPGGLFCPDETDGEAIRVCMQLAESLYGYEVGGYAPEPRLAESCTSNEEGTQWTCTLREGVTFHDGSALDAGDVVLSYALMWDRLHPLHVGRTGQFAYFGGTWGGVLNPAQ
jgi:ABC-type transport system substrate-binding protein